jgi:hypothetical protein
VQDRIALDADEEQALELKRDIVTGQERVVWNPALSLPPKQYEFTDAEIARIKAALQTWDSDSVTADRRWLEPILRMLYSTAENAAAALVPNGI